MEQTASPDPCPAAYEIEVAKIDADVRMLMTFYQIPYYIQAGLAADGFVTMADIAMRWPSREKIASDAADDYKFKDNEAGYTKTSSLRTSIRIAQLVQAATAKAENQTKQITEDKSWDAQATLPSGQRTAMENTWVLKTKLPKPTLEEQGSDHYLGMQYKACSRGEIGFFTNMQIISQLPEPTEASQHRKKRKTDSDGVMHEHEEEIRYDPTTMEAWKKQMTVFRTSLLFCCWMFPQHAQLKISKETLDSLYDFLYGRAIAGRTPAPSMKVLMLTERKAWREISLELHKGTCLDEAVKKVQSDFLFWTREVYERCTLSAASGADRNYSKGKGKGKNSYQKGKGKGRKGQKTKGYSSNYQQQGQNQSSQSPTRSNAAPQKHKPWPNIWASTDPKGKSYCRNYLLMNRCTGGCGRSHQCPALKKNGATCNESHHPDACPNK